MLTYRPVTQRGAFFVELILWFVSSSKTFRKRQEWMAKTIKVNIKTGSFSQHMPWHFLLELLRWLLLPSKAFRQIGSFSRLVLDLLGWLLSPSKNFRNGKSERKENVKVAKRLGHWTAHAANFLLDLLGWYDFQTKARMKEIKNEISWKLGYSVDVSWISSKNSTSILGLLFHPAG